MAIDTRDTTTTLVPGATGAAWGSFIDGAWRANPNAERFEVINPATGKPLASVAVATQDDVDAAVASARRAFESDWRDLPPLERAALLHKLAAYRQQLLRKRA